MSWGIVASVGGSIVGGMLSDSGGGGGSSSTATKDPWAAADPWLRDLITQGQQLSGYYQKTPFNQIQQTGMQNALTDNDSLRQSVVPAMNQVANQFMGSNYQRQPVQRTAFNGGASAALPGGGGMGYSGGMPSGPMQPGGGGMPAPTPMPMPGVQQAPPSIPVMPGGGGAGGPGGYGQLDMNLLNPFTNGGIVAPPPAADPAGGGYTPIPGNNLETWYADPSGNSYRMLPNGMYQNVATADYGTGNGGA